MYSLGLQIFCRYFKIVSPFLLKIPPILTFFFTTAARHIPSPGIWTDVSPPLLPLWACGAVEYLFSSRNRRACSHHHQAAKSLVSCGVGERGLSCPRLLTSGSQSRLLFLFEMFLFRLAAGACVKSGLVTSLRFSSCDCRRAGLGSFWLRILIVDWIIALLVDVAYLARPCITHSLRVKTRVYMLPRSYTV